ncbi:hypothetical protein NMG60_11035656 [Bertholletia excelsa]
MPASSSETRARWRKKRRREPQINRRTKPQDEELDDEEEDEDDLDQQQTEFEEDQNQQQQNPQSGLDPTPISRESEVLSNGGVRISDFPSAIKHTVNRPHPSVLAIVALERAIQAGEGKNLQNGVALENVSHGQLQALSLVPADSLALLPAVDQERADGPFVITPPLIMEGRGVVKQFGNNRVHVVPMHADWFSPNTINRLERQVVPHFFSGKSTEHTPEKYMECRNRIVAKYMENPEIILSVADCQGLVAGIDISDLTRIFRFLDHWGIINYCAAASTFEPWCDGTYLREDSSGEVHVPSPALKSIDSLIQFDKPKCRLKASYIYSSLSRHDYDESDLDSRIREQLSENRCNHCSRPLPIVYYQSQKEVDIQLCLNCFSDGRYVIGHSSIDFVRIDSMKDYGDIDGESWNDQETLLLLEAVEIYNDNWNEIAEHVGTKSKAQCILHFVRLPMEDGPLENIEVPCASLSPKMSKKDDLGRSFSSSNGDSAGSYLQDPNSESRLPFSNSANPVMALVAFLASAVGPRVAAACAHASLAALSEDSGHFNKMNLGSMHNNEDGSHGENANSSLRKEDNSEVHGQWNQNGEVVAFSAERVRGAAKAGLAAAAMKAKLFADHEEREIQRLSANIINHQLKRLELKLKQFAEVETLLMKECEQVERARQRIAAERSRMMSAQFGQTAAVASPMNPPGSGPPNPMVHSSANNRPQQVNTASPSQPFIPPGYANNQPIHPQFVPRQSMYGLGPRLPLSALHPSSSSSASASPNTMFNNAAPNSQPALSNPMLRPVSGASSGGMG